MFSNCLTFRAKIRCHLNSDWYLWKSWISGVIGVYTNNQEITRFFLCWIPLYLQAAAVGTAYYLAWAKGTLLKKGTRLSLQANHPGMPVYQAGRTRGASNCTLLSRLHWGSWNLSCNQIRSLVCGGLKAISNWRLSGINPEVCTKLLVAAVWLIVFDVLNCPAVTSSWQLAEQFLLLGWSAGWWC